MEIEEPIQTRRSHGCRIPFLPRIEKKVRTAFSVKCRAEVQARRFGDRRNPFLALSVDILASDITCKEISERRSEVTQGRTSISPQVHGDEQVSQAVTGRSADRRVSQT